MNVTGIGSGKLNSSEGCMEGLNLTDVRRQRIQLLCCTAPESTLAKDFSFNSKGCVCFCRRTKLPGTGALC